MDKCVRYTCHVRCVYVWHIGRLVAQVLDLWCVRIIAWPMTTATSKKSMKKIPPEITCRKPNLFAAINDTINMYQSNVYHYVICQMVSNGEKEREREKEIRNHTIIGRLRQETTKLNFESFLIDRYVFVNKWFARGHTMVGAVVAAPTNLSGSLQSPLCQLGPTAAVTICFCAVFSLSLVCSFSAIAIVCNAGHKLVVRALSSYLMLCCWTD